MAFAELDTITPWFWEIVAKGERDPERMRQVLSSLSRKELDRFVNRLLSGGVRRVEGVPDG